MKVLAKKEKEDYDTLLEKYNKLLGKYNEEHSNNVNFRKMLIERENNYLKLNKEKNQKIKELEEEMSTLKNKYQKFEPFNQYADFSYQKKITDKVGIKYFIDVNCYNNNCEFEIFNQLNKCCLKILIYSINNMNLSEIENLIKKIWISLGSNYYEKWEEE